MIKNLPAFFSLSPYQDGHKFEPWKGVWHSYKITKDQRYEIILVPLILWCFFFSDLFFMAWIFDFLSLVSIALMFAYEKYRIHNFPYIEEREIPKLEGYFNALCYTVFCVSAIMLVFKILEWL